MRIAVIVGRFPVLSETFILNQIIGLIKRGNKVDIYTLDPQPLDNAKVHSEVEKYRLLEQTYYVLNLPKNYCLRLLKGLWLLVANSYKDPLVVLRSLNIFKYGKKAASLKLLYLSIPLLGKEPYDIIHCQFGPLGQQVIQLRELGVLKGKLVTCFRGYELGEYIKQCGNDVYKELFEKGDFFLTNCEYFKRQLLLLGCDEKKLAVHRSGIDCKKFIFSPPYPPSSDGRVCIAMIGRLVEKKGTEYSIRAVAKLVETSRRNRCSVIPNIELNIIGYGLLREELQQLIQDLNVGDTVKLIGAKISSEIIEILNKSHIFIAPSVTAKNGDKEGIPNVLKEAMAIGLPVISTYHSGIPELVEDGISGFLVPERDVMALFQKLSYMIAHPEVWHEMGRAGRSCVEKYYDSDKLNDRLVEIYQQILANDAKTHLNQSVN